MVEILGLLVDLLVPLRLLVCNGSPHLMAEIVVCHDKMFFGQTHVSQFSGGGS